MTEMEHHRAGDAGPWVPVPDPTQRTLEVLEREVKSIHDKLNTTTEALSAELHSAMTHRAELTDAKLAAVELQFALIESSRVEQKQDSLASLAAALSAAKEAVKEQTSASEKSIAKSETSTTEAIKQLSVTFSASIDSVNRALSDLKERVVSMESQKTGAKDNTASIISAIAIAGVIISIAMSVFSMLAK